VQPWVEMAVPKTKGDWGGFVPGVKKKEICSGRGLTKGLEKIASALHENCLEVEKTDGPRDG